ncbi:B3/B4 domain-containing protein (DNA/RNA-binding domain of Phe-tRNA-synthetase) [Desulfonispora thiosulfatigenes DSM 11270]|uniref:B3/B4 domain-containing protein (DNA/RNA-binding domain of Phe-tRNA-synthetase) n=1 Tax=Desulfonispora thiosulfatigenes DSM 11270 TaxID=656914 RepID=A0A1W1UQV4_DESTI|nr:phenylalanine--tRNA ligase beta subunit-related protein [Desulfonispora thiosulfatigenes]SMB83389.1 B3/B4 domain-containing protein (DNA/RNA-binding domain of Phe-tRNA-synthetase) [Desulfonispora thiosulfatigenes DSM 11270]
MQIQISPELKEIWPEIRLGCLKAKVNLTENNSLLANEMDSLCKEFENKYVIEDINKLPHLKETRSAYKKLGKDPSRYRVSSDALIRRILKGKGLFKINNIVDIINLVSVQTFYSLGAYDLEKIKGNIILTVGKAGESYKGIGRSDIINLENLPVFSDEEGHFGSPTSDSEKAMITLDTKEVLIFINSFSGEEDLNEALDILEEKLVKYASASNIQKSIIK